MPAAGVCDAYASHGLAMGRPPRACAEQGTARPQCRSRAIISQTGFLGQPLQQFQNNNRAWVGTHRVAGFPRAHAPLAAEARAEQGSGDRISASRCRSQSIDGCRA